MIISKWEELIQKNPILIFLVGIPLFSLLSIYNKDQSWFCASLTILFCYFLPNWRLKILSISFLIVGLGWSNNFFSRIHPNIIERSLSVLTQVETGNLYFNQYVYKASALLCYLVFLMAFNIVYSKIFKRFTFLSVVFVLISYAAILTASNYLFYFLNVDLAFLLRLFLLILIKHIWYVFLLIKFSKLQPAKLNLNFVACAVMPFWLMSGETRESFNISNYFPTKEKLTQCYRSGLRALCEAGMYLLLAEICLRICKLIIVSRMPGLDSEENFFYMFNHVFSNQLKYSSLQIWAILFFKGLCHLLLLIYVYGQTFVGASRLCGVDMTDAVNRPWRSKSFYDFISRSMYYYNFIIETYFLYPLFEVFKSLRRFKLLFLLLSIISSVSIGGLVFHLTRDPYSLFNYGLLQTLAMYAQGTLLYYILLGLCISLSIFLEKSRTKKNLFLKIALIFIYIQLYSLILLAYYPRFAVSLQQVYVWIFRL